MKKVVILGAGLGGQLATIAIKRACPDCEITLIGPSTGFPKGLFYFNEKIEGVAERPISIEYSKSGDCSWEEYQYKSRGESLSQETSSKSSLSKAEKGVKETGYLFNLNNNCLNNLESYCTRIFQNCTSINFNRKVVEYKVDGYRYRCEVNYDYLVSTLPYHIFRKLSGRLDISLESKPIYLREFRFNKFKNPLSLTEKVSVEYNCDLSDPIYRKSSYYDSEGNLLVVSEESLTKFDGARKLVPGKILPNSNILSLETDSVKIYGRYAKWDYHYLVTDTYKDAYEFGLSLRS